MQHAGGAPGRNTVEALTFAKAAGTVQVTVGGVTTSCAVKAGVNTCLVPLRAGKVSAKIVRSGATVASLTSPYSVTNAPYVQDFQYVGASSLRQGRTSTPTAPAPAPAPQPAPAGTTRTVVPVADAYANEGAPSSSYGSSSSLAAQGSKAATSYLRFPLPAAPAGTTLTGVRLQVRTTTSASAGSATGHAVRIAGNAWTEGALTWATKPAVTGATLGALTGPKANTAYSTALPATALRPSLGKQVTIAVTGSGTDGLWFWSRNHPSVAYRPQLVLTFG
jgi:hypothetical protein